MTVQDLIQELEQFDPDAEVRLAIQPEWPFEHAVGGVASAAPCRVEWAVRYPIGDGDEDMEFVEGDVFAAQERARELTDELPEDAEIEVVGQVDGGDWLPMEEAEEAIEDAGEVVYIGEAGQLAYLPGAVAHELGWK